jgi:PadR family transcriptional regulator PadR
MANQAELLPGTLDLLILHTVEPGPLYGVGIADRIEQVTSGVFVVGPGSLFPALTGSRIKYTHSLLESEAQSSYWFLRRQQRLRKWIPLYSWSSPFRVLVNVKLGLSVQANKRG